jgi:transcription initiation factor TFIID subunit TAF12
LQQQQQRQQQQKQQQQQQQSQQQAIRNDTLAQLDLSSDLNFDPAAVIDGGGEGQEGLNVS